MSRPIRAFTPASPLYLSSSPQATRPEPYDPSALVCRSEPQASAATDSLQTSQLDETVRAAAAARRSATARAPPPAQRSEPPRRTSQTGGARPRPSDSGAPVAGTRAAADHSARSTALVAHSGGAEHATEGEPPARGRGRAGARGKSDRDQQRDQTQGRLARPPALPVTGGSALRRESFSIDVRVHPFQASRSVPLPPGERAATGRDGKPLPNPAVGPAAAAQRFGEAVGAAESFYARLVAAARRSASDAVRDNMRAADRARSALDRDLADLDKVLGDSRITLDRARDFAIEHVQSLALLMRRRIRRAAASAFGRLDRMRHDYDRLMGPPRATRQTVTDDLTNALTDTNSKANAAHFALQGFGVTPTLAAADFPGDAAGTAVTRAKTEAALQFIGPYVAADDEATARRLTDIEKALNPLKDCLPCQMDGAFQLLDMRMDHLTVAGPNAVAATRDGALQSVNDLVDQLTLSIRDTHSTIARQLVGQHDRTRRDLVTQQRLEGEAEREDLHSSGMRQTDMFSALAEGQARGVIEAQQRLTGVIARGGGDYAAALLAGARRLRANIAGMERRYPAEPFATADARTAARERRHEGSERMRANTLAATNQAMETMVRSTFADLNASSDKSFFDMHETPDRVRSSCESFLGPAEAARNVEIGALTQSVNRISDAVHSAIRGEPASGGGSATNTSQDDPQAQVCRAEPAQSTAAATSTPAASPQSSSAVAGGGGAREAMPPPASCAHCPTANAPAQPAAGASATPGTQPGAQQSGNQQGGPTGAAGSQAPPQQSQAPDATSSGSDRYGSSVDFRSYCETVARNPKSADGVRAFLARVDKAVPEQLSARAGQAHGALDHWRQPDTPTLMAALRGLSAASGAALQEIYRGGGDRPSYGSLRDSINAKYDDAINYTFGAPSTIEYNRAAALAAIDGDIQGAAMNELRASFNYSNEDERIRTIMGALTPAQMDALPQSELDALATQLDGEDRKRFDELRRHHGGMDRAVTLADALDTANRLEGDARGRGVQTAMAQAYTTQELNVEGPAERQTADIFHLEQQDQKDARRAAHWHDTLAAFSGLDRVHATLDRPGQTQTATATAAAGPNPASAAPSPAAPVSTAQGATTTAAPQPGTATAQGVSGAGPAPGTPGSTAAATPEAAPNPDQALEDALIGYATRPIYHPPPPPPARAHGEGVDYSDRQGHTDQMAPDMLNWVEQTVRHGPESVAARGAQLLVEYNRASAHGSAERVDLALHIGSADAREGGGDQARSSAAAERQRDEVFQQFARYRDSLAGQSFIGPIDVRATQADIRNRFSTALTGDPAAQALATGIIDGERGDPRAAIDYAIAHENTEMALRYLRRMDRGQVDDLIAGWNRDHPGGPTLYEKLGLFQHHWSVTNWTGAVFTGDEANELEIAIMGVPRNDKERAEVALRTMNQQIEQSTGLGRLLAGGEYDQLVANRDALLRLIGRDNYQIGSDGRLLVNDPITGQRLGLGAFDAHGNILPARAGQGTAFERAVGLARYTATEFTQAVDAAANFFTTLLVVIAAVVTTVLTGGAAASIWIPMLVTAAAGLAGVALTAAIKGGRYSRDEVTRDLIMVAVQTVTAGIGAAGSVAARGGLPALRAVASRGISQGFKLSESALERFVVMKGGTLAASAGLGAELAIGAAGGALSGGVTAALDPSNRRSEDYGDQIWGGIFRGAAGGAAGAGAARGLGAGLGAAGNRVAGVAASSSARRALAAGLSREEALEQALLAARRASWISAGVTRAITSGASGSASRITELGLEGRASFGQIMDEGRMAFVQNAFQGALEHGVDPGHRQTMSRGGAPLSEAELRRMPSSQREEQLHLQATAEGAVAHAYDRPARPAAGAGPVEAVNIPAAPRAEEAPVARGGGGAGAITDPAAGVTHARRGTPADEIAVTFRAAPHEEEVTRAAHIPSEEDSDILRSNIPPSERPTLPEIPAVRAAAGHEEKPLTFAELTASKGGPPPGQRVVDSVDLTAEMLRSAHSLPEGSIIRGGNPQDRAVAELNYQLMRERDPHREVLLAFHPETGEYAVVQGGMDSVRKPSGGGWVAERHTHPRTYLVNEQAAILHSLPSGKPGDFAALISEAQAIAARPDRGGVAVRASKIDIVQPDGSLTETTFAVILQHEKMELVVTFRDPSGRQQELGPFFSIADYAADVLRLTGTDINKSAKPTAEGSYNVIPGSRRGPPVTADEIATARFVADRMGAAVEAGGPVRALGVTSETEVRPFSAAAEEAHNAVRRMGLIGEPDSLSRLTNLLNADDPGFTPAMRSAVANATLEATRADLIRTGQLAPGDDVLMLFRGVTRERLSDYEREGMNLAKLGPGTDEDAGRGLYGSQDFESALRYTGPEAAGGQVLPLIVRRSELGNVIDVRSGTPLGDRWLQFIRASEGKRRIWPEHAHLRGQLYPGHDAPIAVVRDLRGSRFEAFLTRVADDPALPESVRAAARDPHITLMDLGGVASTGNDRGILTDQWAMHSQEIANLFNEAHGFPSPGRSGAAAGEESDVMHTNIRQQAETRGAAHGREIESERAGTAPIAEGSETVRPKTTAEKPARPSKRGAQPLDLEEAEIAGRTKQSAERAAREVREDARQARETARASAGEGNVKALTSRRPQETDDAKRIISAIEEGSPLSGERATAEQRARALQDRVDELHDTIRFSEDLDQATQAFLRWKEQVWRRQASLQSVEETGKRTLVPGLAEVDELSPQLRQQIEQAAVTGEVRRVVSVADQRAIEAELRAESARQAETAATRSVKDEMRRKGPNYRDKQDVEFDEILGGDRFRLREADSGRSIPLDVDHLVPLNTIANLEELKPLFAIYNRARPEQREAIRQALRRLGDIPDNLVAMQRRPNQNIKNARQWSECDRAALAAHGYTDADIERMIQREQDIRAAIIATIAELIKVHSARLAAERFRATRQPTTLSAAVETDDDPAEPGP